MFSRTRAKPAHRALVAALALAGSFGAACGERRETRHGGSADPGVPGRFLSIEAPGQAAAPVALPGGDAERLGAIGYAAGSRIAPERSGVTRHDPARSWPGVNLVVSGHAPEATLVAMDGSPLHRWRFAWWGAAPAESDRDPLERSYPEFWRRAHLGAGGELIALFDGLGLVKLDRNSRPLWTLELPVHHDLEVLPDGRIAVLTREPRRMPSLDPQRDVLDDSIAILDAGGRVLQRISLLDALTASPHADLLRRREAGRRYILHANTLEILDGRLADRIGAFREGNALVSLLGLDAIAVVDLDAQQVVWALTGDFVDQHDPTVLANGSLLLFDNVGLGDASRVLELDPVSGQELWSYRGSPAEPFFTRWCGAAQRLPNGNTLISETDAGRALEVTPDGETVWEFYNPWRAGASDEYIASLFEVLRHPADVLGSEPRPR
jgi:hypothetical protein